MFCFGLNLYIILLISLNHCDVFPLNSVLLALGYMIVFRDTSIWVILDWLACAMQSVKLFVILFFTPVFHCKFVSHTTTIVYLNFICRHVDIFLAFSCVLLLCT